MRRKLGSIVLLLFCISFEVHAWVKITAPQSIMKTEALEFTLVAKGFVLTFPKIEQIEGYRVKNIQTSSEAVIIDTKKAKKITKIYSFIPDKNVTLPAFTVEVDGKLERTKPLHVTVKKLTQTDSPDYKLSMSISNKSLMVGEKLSLHVRLVYKDLQDYEVISPLFAGFTLHEISDKEYKNNKGEWVEELEYEIMPQKSGTFVLHPVKADIELVFPKYKRRHIYSNALKLVVSPIPQNLSVVGTYKLSASVNSKIVNQNQAVKYTLRLQGSGNVNNFDEFHISIPHAGVYERNTTHVHKNGKDIYEKNFAIVSDVNFTIPSVGLQYFDIQEQKIKNLQTQSFTIGVENSVYTKKTIQKEKMTMMEKILYFILGGITMLFVVYIYTMFKNTTIPNKQKELKKELQKIQNKELFFKKVVPFLGKNKTLNRLIYTLENIDNSEFKNIKKEIIAILYK
ncbi:BatD family protein [Sulfurimonas sp.]